MRTLVIGDIHGCSVALRTLLDAVRPGPEDVLITLGDYVDRGPDSKGVIDILIGLESTTQLKPLTGNHEILFLEAFAERIDPQGWLRVGGAETLISYSGDPSKISFAAVSKEHLNFLSERCLRYYEDAKHFYVHANANSVYALADQNDDWLFWTRFSDAFPHVSGKTMICGHSAQKSGLPAVRPFAICIDTWIYGQGWLTCLEVETGAIYQANEKGELRTLNLAELDVISDTSTQNIKLPALPGS
ncbi:MAG: metallophosphoesterase [Verrucomicrobia bacterium]|nr:metallophosphoesterase [Verrucomicrobiota bacterium]